jgi:hypothetical protein
MSQIKLSEHDQDAMDRMNTIHHDHVAAVYKQTQKLLAAKRKENANLRGVITKLKKKLAVAEGRNVKNDE